MKILIVALAFLIGCTPQKEIQSEMVTFILVEKKSAERFINGEWNHYTYLSWKDPHGVIHTVMVLAPAGARYQIGQKVFGIIDN